MYSVMFFYSVFTIIYSMQWKAGQGIQGEGMSEIHVVTVRVYDGFRC